MNRQRDIRNRPSAFLSNPQVEFGRTSDVFNPQVEGSPVKDPRVDYVSSPTGGGSSKVYESFANPKQPLWDLMSKMQGRDPYQVKKKTRGHHTIAAGASHPFKTDFNWDKNQEILGKTAYSADNLQDISGEWRGAFNELAKRFANSYANEDFAAITKNTLEDNQEEMVGAYNALASRLNDLYLL